VTGKKVDYAFPTLTGAILESISDGVFTVDHDWRVTSFNRAAEEITDIPRKEALDRLCSEVFKGGCHVAK
jgi:PAS domain-containing protein